MLAYRCLVVFVFAALFAGCAPAYQGAGTMLPGGPRIQTAFIPTQNIQATARAENCYLDIDLDRNPVRPFVVVGQASATWTGSGQEALNATEETVFPHLRAEACRAGGHVIFQVNSQYQDQWASGFARTIRSTALVGVYVTRRGALMASPDRPRRVIRVPETLDLPAAEEGTGTDALDWNQGITDPWAVPIR